MAESSGSGGRRRPESSDEVVDATGRRVQLLLCRVQLLLCLLWQGHQGQGLVRHMEAAAAMPAAAVAGAAPAPARLLGPAWLPPRQAAIIPPRALSVRVRAATGAVAAVGPALSPVICRALHPPPQP
jgi:hypothetical protein